MAPSLFPTDSRKRYVGVWEVVIAILIIGQRLRRTIFIGTDYRLDLTLTGVCDEVNHREDIFSILESHRRKRGKIIEQQKIHCHRLTPGIDLKEFLRQWANQNSIRAAVVISSVGSLKTVHIRLANTDKVFHSEGPFEIISLNGTLSRGGLHLHMAVADGNGTTWGGHLLDGNLIYTTCELVLMEIPDVEFVREIDPQTGFLELSCRNLTLLPK